MVAVALVGTALALAGPLWSDGVRREREGEALRVGAQYASAIRQYYLASPGVREYPATMNDLLEDTRFVGTVRHLRRLWTDPLRPGQAWVPVRGPDGRIHGVRSASDDAPFRRTSVDLGDVVLPPASRYADWQFVAREDR